MPRIKFTDYDPQWPARYRAEARRLRALLGERVVSFEHVGSTAIPGLCAKPTIDIMGDARTVQDAEACAPMLASAGYRFRAEPDIDWPDRRFFYFEVREIRHFQLHLVQRASPFWDRYLKFRNALRERPEAALAYRELKRRLAAEFPCDLQAYTHSKSRFVMKILKSVDA